MTTKRSITAPPPFWQFTPSEEFPELQIELLLGAQLPEITKRIRWARQIISQLHRAPDGERLEGSALAAKAQDYALHLQSGFAATRRLYAFGSHPSISEEIKAPLRKIDAEHIKESAKFYLHFLDIGDRPGKKDEAKNLLHRLVTLFYELDCIVKGRTLLPYFLPNFPDCPWPGDEAIAPTLQRCPKECGSFRQFAFGADGKSLTSENDLVELISCLDESRYTGQPGGCLFWVPNDLLKADEITKMVAPISATLRKKAAALAPMMKDSKRKRPTDRVIWVGHLILWRHYDKRPKKMRLAMYRELSAAESARRKSKRGFGVETEPWQRYRPKEGSEDWLPANFNEVAKHAKKCLKMEQELFEKIDDQCAIPR